MTPERWQQVSRIFKSAISLDDEARVAYVARQCGVDESLRAEVEKLIDSHQQAESGNFIGGAAVEQIAALLVDENEGKASERALNKGQQLGSYVVLDRLGAGGMGEVYLARDSRLDRTVALKVLSQDVASDKRRMQRFRQEAKVASSLNQPNILTIFEFGEIDGLTFLATEYIDGETLRHYLHGQKLKLGEVLDIAIQVLAALDAAHDARIAHRDIKPENIMIRRRDGLVKVLDFGLAKVTEKRAPTQAVDVSEEAATEFKTVPGMIMGTVNYMSPEQATAKTVDERSDIWSTGVMLYEMLTGELPFTGATSSHTIVQILEKDPVPPSKRAAVPAELERIVLKSMTKNANERYQTAKDMLIDLRSLKKRLDVQAEIDRTSSPEINVAADDTDKKSDKKRVVVIALIVMGVVTAGIFAVNVWRSRVRSTFAPAPAPAPAAAPVSERMLTYWITVQKFRNERPYEGQFTLPGEMIFEQDYQIRVHIRSPQDGHLYIFNEGPPKGVLPPEFVVVFPTSTANNGSSQIFREQVVPIPEKTWLAFDAERGTEKLWLVFSEQPLPELEAARGYASERARMLITVPSVNKDLQNFLNNTSLPRPTSERGERQTTLKAPGKVLVYPIKLEHH
ncbi:MAG TPA: protein kinase [Pyrinomonadaceae bacterium]|nr:protein kinase [Pyrinomonadaceae bacterium]